MKKRILCVILSLAAVFSLIGFNATEAWFSDGKNVGMELKSGNLNFSTDSFKFEPTDENGYILPGTELEPKKIDADGNVVGDGIVINNNSNIDTMLRIKVECEYATDEKDENGETVKIKAPWLSFNLSKEDETWWGVEEDNVTYLYYCPNGYDAENTDPDYEPDFRIPANSETKTISFNNNLIISGEVPLEMKEKEIYFTVAIQAKQADFMEWSKFTPDSGNENPENAA